MPKFLLLSTFLLWFHTQSFAQLADKGAGSLKNLVWWMDWADVKIEDGITKTFITADGLTITATFSGVAGTPLAPGIMNTWNGAILKNLYNFSDPAIKPAIAAPNNFNNSNFTLTVKATRRGKPIAFTLVASDAEASNSLETLTMTTSAGNWRTLEFFRNSSQVNNPASGCGTQTISITETYAGTPNVGQLPIVATDVPATGNVKVDVSLLRSTHGSSAVAFGIIEAVDEGDLPASYGYATHQLVYATQNPCNAQAPLPATAWDTNLKLGSIAGDADAVGMSDDNQQGQDEEAVTAFRDYNGNGVYDVTVPLTNTTGKTAYLSAWFDYNRNGMFEVNESVTATVAPNATVATLTWTSLPAGFIAGRVPLYGFRFRLSTDLQAVRTPNGLAPDGEVEDYLVSIKAPCSANINTLSNMVLCAGKPAQLNATGGISYKWTPATGLSSDSIPDPVATPTVTTTYKVSGVDASGCPGTATLTIYVNPSPIFTKRSDTAICAGNSLQLSAVSDIPATYSWWPDSSLNNSIIPNPVATPLTSTSYTITATTIYGCTSKSAINITVNPAPDMRVMPDTPVVCLGQSVEIQARGADVYEWYTDRDSLLTTNSLIAVAPTCDSTFKIYMEQHTCAVADTFLVPVKVYDLPVTAVTKSGDIDCAHPEVLLEASGGVYYNWQPANGMANNLVANPVVSPVKTATYEVTVMDEHGCTQVETVTVNVDIALAFTRSPIPTAFTPNGDGKNDCFGLKFWGETNTFEFSIYNRVGNLVFNTRYPGDCWDGTFKGMEQPAGSYIYMIKAKTICGDVLRRGTVVLAR
ncbi:CshA/CshB family fibrillar adhesin-related protein [Chitinophaga filiformis]|uniref:CshA/CshB family fibrillar adhesin-related protein n=1 Tax=Chitinophaga filiformis TaxID=104663 RepID=A0ABY4HZJ7_CHIFI|nr:CshA/CshB family fibrillar adhesin-related protein [Chitinophaga filiformis]UPK67931.1 CshA/CshB family fibrillar adhesin-related protein [Chitinophaga filiformis]